MSTYQSIAGLPVQIDGYELEELGQDVSSGMRRVTTVIHLHGAGQTGVGEDVIYETEDQLSQLEAGPTLDLAGSRTIDQFSHHLGTIDLFPAGPPQREPSRNYRRWAYESAALDLALKQAGAPLWEVLDREPSPLRFVVSTRLDEPASARRVTDWLARDPTLRFKLDPTDTWTDSVVADLAATGAVDAVDLKGFYRGTIVDLAPDGVLYRRIAEGFPTAWLEDPWLTEETRAALAGHEERFTWDAPLHSVDDIVALERVPRCINIKPSRFGPLSSLCAVYDYVAEHGIDAYGGGQFELGPGRGQIQYLASLFHPDGPNDVAPTGFNEATPPADLPSPPMAPAPAATGFTWGERS